MVRDEIVDASGYPWGKLPLSDEFLEECMVRYRGGAAGDWVPRLVAEIQRLRQCVAEFESKTCAKCGLYHVNWKQLTSSFVGGCEGLWIDMDSKLPDGYCSGWEKIGGGDLPEEGGQ